MQHTSTWSPNARSAALTIHTKVPFRPFFVPLEDTPQSSPAPLPRCRTSGTQKLTLKRLSSPTARVRQNKPTTFPFQLHSAAKGGSERVVAALLGAGSGPDVNQRTQVGNRECPLHIAAKLGHSEVAAALVRAGADVNSRDRNDWAPLHLAARFGQLQVAGH